MPDPGPADRNALSSPSVMLHPATIDRHSSTQDSIDFGFTPFRNIVLDRFVYFLYLLETEREKEQAGV